MRLSTVVLTDAAESRPLLFVLCLKFVGHHNSTNLADYVKGILCHDVYKEPEALVNQQIIGHNGFVLGPLLPIGLRFLLRRFITEVEWIAKATLYKITTARAASLFKSVVLQCDEPNQTEEVHEEDPWPRTIIHLIF